jgi:TPP-dependent 2-oxoacid decarboxylase
MRAPKGVSFLTQILWGSIGYSVGAALGAALAGKQENRRVFVLVGDGSFQVRNLQNEIEIRKIFILACLSRNINDVTI